MSASKRRSRRPPRTRASTKGAKSKSAVDWTAWPLWLLVVALPLVYAEPLQNNFRLPKLLFAEWVAACSLVTLAWRLRAVERVDLGAVLRRPVVWAAGALMLAAAIGLVASEHAVFVRPAVRSLVLALLCLVVWEAALRMRELRSLVIGLSLPAAILALVAVLQHLDVYQPFPLQVDADSRLALTSFAGSPFDLATFLVLPVLVAQGALARSDLSRPARLGWALLLALMLYAVALTQTVSALAAIALGSVVLWAQLADRRRFAGIALAGTIIGGAVIGLAPPLRERVGAKVEQLRGGDLNDVLTGRLDSWRAGLWMVEQRPVVGIGHGAYRAEFAAARLALVDRGVSFYRRQQQPFFENPHSDLLAVVIGMGALGGLAALAGLAWLARSAAGAWRSWRALGAAGRIDAAVMSAVLVAVLLQTTATFPLHLAMVTYPLLLLAALVFRAGRLARCGAASAAADARSAA